MATGKVNSQGTPLSKRSGPGTSYAVVGTLLDGVSVNITCQTSGTTVTGQYGPTSVWDRLDDGTYVSDAFIYTGTNNMVAPPCSISTGQAGDSDSVQARLSRFIDDWAGKYLNYDDSVPNQCFSVAQAWAKMYLRLHDFTGATAVGIIDQGPPDFTRHDMAPGDVPPAGAIVVFQQCPEWEIGPAGHVDVCVSGNADGFTGFDQNWGTPTYCRQVNHSDYNGVIGYLTANRLG